MRYIERQILLQVIDNRWKEHLYEMDYLREGIHLRGFAQIDPLVAYKNEGYTMFAELLSAIWEEFLRLVFHVEVEIEEPPDEGLFGPAQTSEVEYSGGTLEHPRRSARRRPATAAASQFASRRPPAPPPARPPALPLAATRSAAPSSRPTRRRSAATTPAGADRARSSRSATVPSVGPETGERIDAVRAQLKLLADYL